MAGPYCDRLSVRLVGSVNPRARAPGSRAPLDIPPLRQIKSSGRQLKVRGSVRAGGELCCSRLGPNTNLQRWPGCDCICGVRTGEVAAAWLPRSPARVTMLAAVACAVPVAGRQNQSDQPAGPRPPSHGNPPQVFNTYTTRGIPTCSTVLSSPHRTLGPRIPQQQGRVPSLPGLPIQSCKCRTK